MDITARGVTGQVWPERVYGFTLCDGDNCIYEHGQGISCRDLHPVDITDLLNAIHEAAPVGGLARLRAGVEGLDYPADNSAGEGDTGD